ncbi:MAG: hypothetical protein LBQ28_03710 [Prevotellaceae bacterium]|jgi:hypothetical protein|nr:hypothetical protein [Prevotellaceae bacterium]
MNNLDYIPRQDGKFLEWVKILFAYVDAHASAWNISPNEVALVETLIAAYDAAYAKSEDPNRGRADVIAKDESRDTLKHAVRQFVREHLTYNSAVTDEDRRHMGLPVHDTKPTPAPPITDMPVGEVDFSVHQRHTLRVKAGKLTGKTKPEHAKGFEVWRKVGGDPPATDSDWVYAGFSSRSPLVIDYPLEDVGKTVYYRFRWMNTRNLPGPWSESIISAVIA